MQTYRNTLNRALAGAYQYALSTGPVLLPALAFGLAGEWLL